MARAGGLNLAGARARGDMDQACWAGIVERCRGCGWTCECERFLSRSARIDSLPEKCRNRIQFGALKALEEMEEYA